MPPPNPTIPKRKAMPIKEKATGNPAKRLKSMQGNMKRGRYSEPIIPYL
jgi:hypothetical protein